MKNNKCIICGLPLTCTRCEEIVTEPLKTRDDIKDMYEQLLDLEQLLHLDVLEKTLVDVEKYMIDVQVKFIYIKFIKSEIERIKQELGLEE